MPISSVAPVVMAAPRPAPASGAARFEVGPAAQAAAPTLPGPAARLDQAVRSLEASQARLDRVLHAARAGRSFTAGELLALQADAYRFTQTLDVAAKLVEHGVQSVKQAVNAQV